MCLITNIERVACLNSRGGVNFVWLTECSNVTDITFGANGEVTAFTMDGVAVFNTIDPQKNTASFTDAGTKVNNASRNRVQTLTFFTEGMSITLNEQLENLDKCCCYIGVVRDNNGNRFLIGVTYDSDTATWRTEDLITTDTSYNSGADPTADTAQSTIVLSCNAGSRAPLLDPTCTIPV